MNPIAAALTFGSTGNKNLDAIVETLKARAVSPTPVAPPGEKGFASVADLGDDAFTEEAMYGGMSAAEVKKHKTLNATLAKRGEIYHPVHKKVFKLGAGNNRLLVTQDQMQDVVTDAMQSKPVTIEAGDAMRMALLAKKGLTIDPQSGDVVPVKKK